jgi:DNA-binding MarR family transcriptional regulator
MQENPQAATDPVATILLLMEQLSQLGDRCNFLRQRCSGLGRMECQTLQLLEGYRLRKPQIRERIRRRELSGTELQIYLPRNLRKEYDEGRLRPEQIEELPRDLSMKALADEIGVACSRMTRIGDTLSDDVDPLTRQMRGKGMVHREASPDDRRVILIGITPQGSAKVAEQSRQTERLARQLLERIPADQLPLVEQGLGVYLKALGELLPRLAEEAEEAQRDDCRG